MPDGKQAVPKVIYFMPKHEKGQSEKVAKDNRKAVDQLIQQMIRGERQKVMTYREFRALIKDVGIRIRSVRLDQVLQFGGQNLCFCASAGFVAPYHAMAALNSEKKGATRKVDHQSLRKAN